MATTSAWSTCRSTGHQSCGARWPSSGPRRSASALTTWPTCPRWWTWLNGLRPCCPAAWSSRAATASRSWPSTSSRTPTAPSTSCSRAKARPAPPPCSPRHRTGRWPRCPARSPLPARHLGGRRRKYFIGVMDPAASIEFTRGCPWDCSFCSAWTFYGRSYRRLSPEAAVEDMARIAEPGVFVVDDVAFIKPEEGHQIADLIERRGIRKEYYLETRCDVLLRNEEIFRRWKHLGLNYMFLGLEALDEEGLKAFRKRTTPAVNNKALEVARSIGLSVAINIIADPDWDEARFAFVREWAMSVPEIVNITVQTPYPGTETWVTESRRLTTLDYRL